MSKMALKQLLFKLFLLSLVLLPSSVCWAASEAPSPNLQKTPTSILVQLSEGHEDEAQVILHKVSKLSGIASKDLAIRPLLLSRKTQNIYKITLPSEQQAASVLQALHEDPQFTASANHRMRTQK